MNRLTTRARLLIAALAVAAAPLPAHGELVDAIVATVGEEVILLSDLRSEAAPVLFDLRQQNLDPAEYEARRGEIIEQALDEAIENAVLAREARRLGVDIPTTVIDQRLEELRQHYPSEEAFQQDLQQAGETMSELRSRLRRQSMAIQVGMQRRQQFERAVTVSESDVAQYYQENLHQFQRPERVRVRQIFLAADNDAEREAAHAQMEEILAELEAGASFEDLAREHSQALDGPQGGLLGWQQQGDLVEPLNSAAFALAEGEVTEPLDTDFGVSLLKADAREDADVAPLDEVRAAISAELRQQRAQRRYDQWMTELRRQSGVQVFQTAELF